jgi:hypothetical protein
VLNCGLRIPPAAGSGSGTNDSPLGNNRTYVYCGEDFSYERWWEGLDAGRVFVTNGPLLRPLVQGKPPGHVFPLRPGETLTLEIGLELATRVPVDYLQIIKNGQVEAEVRLADWKQKKGRLPPVVFDDSGWFLVRAVTNNRRTYQFASSGPYYVERAGSERISSRSVQFFLEWIDAAKARLGKLKDIDDADRAALLAEQESARLLRGLTVQSQRGVIVGGHFRSDRPRKRRKCRYFRFSAATCGAGGPLHSDIVSMCAALPVIARELASMTTTTVVVARRPDRVAGMRRSLFWGTIEPVVPVTRRRASWPTISF